MNDLDALKLNIKSNDYFGTLSTVLSLVRQNIEKREGCEFNISLFFC